jgi:hypothetical protein
MERHEQIKWDLLQLLRIGEATDEPTYLSEFETKVLRSLDPIEINETEEVTVLGQRGMSYY